MCRRPTTEKMPRPPSTHWRYPLAFEGVSIRRINLQTNNDTPQLPSAILPPAPPCKGRVDGIYKSHVESADGGHDSSGPSFAANCRLTEVLNSSSGGRRAFEKLSPVFQNRTTLDAAKSRPYVHFR